jgi:hypothetical protein
MPAYAASNRRRQKRYDRDAPVALFLEGRPLRDTSLLNLSKRGMCVELLDAPPEGRSLFFRLDLPYCPAVCGTGVVRWVKPFHLGWRCGMEVIGLGFMDKWRLKNYLEPGLPEVSRALDAALLIAAAGAALYMILDRFGWVR